VKISWVIEKRFSALIQDLNLFDEIIECDFKAWKKQGLKSFASIKSFITKLRSKNYDLALDFQANTKSGLILGFTKALEKRSYAFKDVAEWPNILFSSKKMRANYTYCYDFYDSLISDLIQTCERQILEIQRLDVVKIESYGKRTVLLGLSSAWKSKTLSFDQIKQLLAFLNQQEPTYFLITCEEKQIPHYKPLLQLFEAEILCFSRVSAYLPYFKKADLFVGVDSAFYHLAKILGIKTLGIFGPSNHLFYGSPDDIQGICPYGQTFIKRCPKLRTCPAPCIKKIKF
jgi:heptosyltransferase-1